VCASWVVQTDMGGDKELLTPEESSVGCTRGNAQGGKGGFGKLFQLYWGYTSMMDTVGRICISYPDSTI
jgi:hypothetical protein